MSNISELLEKTSEIDELTSKIKLINRKIARHGEKFEDLRQFFRSTKKSNPGIDKDDSEDLYIFLNNRLLYTNKIEKILKEANILSKLSVEKCEIGDEDSVKECFEKNKNNFEFCQSIEIHIQKMNQKYCEKLIEKIGIKYKKNYDGMKINHAVGQTRGGCFLLNALYEKYVLKRPCDDLLIECFYDTNNNLKEKDSTNSTGRE